MKFLQAKDFYQLASILGLICFVVSVLLLGSEKYGAFSKTFSMPLGIICILTVISRKKSGGDMYLYAVSFVASVAYLIILFFISEEMFFGD